VTGVTIDNSSAACARFVAEEAGLIRARGSSGPGVAFIVMLVDFPSKRRTRPCIYKLFAIRSTRRGHRPRAEERRASSPRDIDSTGSTRRRRGGNLAISSLDALQFVPRRGDFNRRELSRSFSTTRSTSFERRARPFINGSSASLATADCAREEGLR